MGWLGLIKVDWWFCLAPYPKHWGWSEPFGIRSYLISTKGRQNPWNPPVKIGIAGTYNFICPSYDHQFSPNYIVNEDNQYWEKLGCVSQVAGSQLSENGAYPQYVANGFRVHWVHSIPVGQVWTRTKVPRSTDCEISATTNQNPRSTKRIMSLCKKSTSCYINQLQTPNHCIHDHLYGWWASLYLWWT